MVSFTQPVLSYSTGLALGSMCICPGDSPVIVRTELTGGEGCVSARRSLPSVTGMRFLPILSHISLIFPNDEYEMISQYILICYHLLAFYLHFIMKQLQTK